MKYICLTSKAAADGEALECTAKWAIALSLWESGR